MMNSRSLVLLIGLSALGHAGAQIGNVPASALSSQGSTVGRQVQNAPPVNAAGVAPSPAVVVGTPNLGAAPKTGGLTPAQMTKPATPTPGSLPPSQQASQSMKTGNIASYVDGIRVVEPTQGSAIARGALRVRATHGSDYDGQQLVEVELSLYPHGTAELPNPGFGPPVDTHLPSPPIVITWQVSLDLLAKGWVPPRDWKIANWSGDAALRIRPLGAQAGPSSDLIGFTLGSNSERQATTAGTQSIRGAQNPRSLATQNSFNSSGGASTAQPSSPALKPGP